MVMMIMLKMQYLYQNDVFSFLHSQQILLGLAACLSYLKNSQYNLLYLKIKTKFIIQILRSVLLNMIKCGKNNFSAHIILNYHMKNRDTCESLAVKIENIVRSSSSAKL